MSTLKVNTIQNTSGVEVYTTKAWISFVGTGTVSTRASGNVSSLIDNGVGLYTINFSSAMPDANYSVNSGALRYDPNNYGGFVRIPNNATPATGSVQIGTTIAWNDSGGNQDFSIASMSISR